MQSPGVEMTVQSGEGSEVGPVIRVMAERDAATRLPHCPIARAKQPIVPRKLTWGKFISISCRDSLHRFPAQWAAI